MIKNLVIPSFVDGNEWAACFGLSWADLMLKDQVAEQPKMLTAGGMYLREVAGTMGVAEGRNHIVNAFLAATRGEWLFMVDTDMGFEPDIVDRMVASAEANKVQVLGALCFALKAKGKGETALHARRHRITPTLYRYVDIGKEQGFLPIMDYGKDSFQYVDATGAAALLIHRDAALKVGDNPFRPMIVRGANPDGTDRAFSEDLSFCSRMASAGVAIGVDTSIKTTHYKTGLYLDEETYQAERAQEKASPFGIREKVSA